MTTVNVTVFKARQGVSKSNKPYFQQMLEIPQDGRPSAQFQRFANDAANVIAEGHYTATVGFYNKQFKLADGKTAYELVATLSDFRPVTK